MDDEHFLDYVSTRSPVFKQRPLPRSKKEAIDLMVEQPNLIRRPVLIRGSKVIFGFDKEVHLTCVAFSNPQDKYYCPLRATVARILSFA